MGNGKIRITIEYLLDKDRFSEMDLQEIKDNVEDNLKEFVDTANELSDFAYVTVKEE
jgi:hypothetical protein